jgi:uncharacterized protein YecE (DUF72 family)
LPCPKSFQPSPESIRNLSTFFHAIDRNNHALGWEPRGEDWTPALIRDLCAECKLVHVVDPFQSDSVYGDGLYWRLHGRQGYRYRYTDEDLAELNEKLHAQARIPAVHPWDAFPFILLTMFVSMEGVILALFVLMKQNRMSRRADERDHLHLQINLLAEKEVTTMLQLQQRLMSHLGMAQQTQDSEVQQLAAETAIENLANELKQRLPEE